MTFKLPLGPFTVISVPGVASSGTVKLITCGRQDAAMTTLDSPGFESSSPGITFSSAPSTLLLPKPFFHILCIKLDSSSASAPLTTGNFVVPSPSLLSLIFMLSHW
eukprot:CAMPEP_0178404410 /NCGR_PEP_ID=MMETSP0689_2-20121128/17870_1 /TAXON_ID=160604 /ORGANISM="Amphidinium massartii, Strain CS-259" /LENGTH=105 /DNA_ID=CAMNT_0020025395 /DNA_START=535 /DNA_END=849 /DNA_ORIENTATION=-